MSSSYISHLRATFLLGVPLVASQVLQMLVGVTDTVMVGWLGASELAAGTLGFQFTFILIIFSYGLGSAMMTLIANALGSNRVTQVRWILRMGLWSLLSLSLFFQIPLWFIDDILLLFGQKPDVVALTETYIIFAQWSLIPAFIFVGIRVFLTALERPIDLLFISVFWVIINAILNYLLIFGNFGFPRLEILGAGLATLISNILVVSIGFCYILRPSIYRTYNLFFRFFTPRWLTAKEIFRLGIPVGFSIFAEAGLFTATSLMMGLISTIALAAHGIALQIASLAFMVPLGLAQAASVRIAKAFGAKSHDDITRAAWAVLTITIGFCTCAILLFISIPEILVGIFVDWENPDSHSILMYAVPLIWVAAAFQLVDSLQVVGAALLRGLKDTKIPLYIAVFSYWIIGIPTAWILGFWLKLEGIGIWSGLAIGLLIAAFSLILRFLRRESLGLI